ncbi:PQQ-dependent sugar dehydrogenase [soil metagenome]
MILSFLSCNSGISEITNPQNTPYTLQEAYPGITIAHPVEFISPDDGSNRIFVLAQKGEIHVFPNETGVNSTKIFMDIVSQVASGGERGLLGLAFHPDFQNNGYFYLNYTKNNPNETVISRFTARRNDPDQADPDSELVLYKFAQPFGNHNGGKLAFGPDGYLYVSAGDGGSGGDPQNHGQNRSTLLGTIMRIDVDDREGNNNYAIPADNPYKGNSQGYMEEIYAYGLRNVWKFSFDFETNRLWAADVGQNRIEEVNIIENGGNYGWNIMEASDCFEPKSNCNTSRLILPVHEYLQESGAGRSITGGFVYRGESIPSLKGKYIYGDYQSGNVWALGYDGSKATSNDLLFNSGKFISGFGLDSQNEIYVLSYTDGKIYKLTQKTP